MQSLDEPFEPFAHMSEFVSQLERANSIPRVLEIARTYLWSWASERTVAIRAEAEGSAPFDDTGQPVPVYALADVIAISRALDDRCEAIRASARAPSWDLVELDRFFMVANAVLAEMLSLSFTQRGEPHPLPPARLAARR